MQSHRHEKNECSTVRNPQETRCRTRDIVCQFVQCSTIMEFATLFPYRLFPSMIYEFKGLSINIFYYLQFYSTRLCTFLFSCLLTILFDLVSYSIGSTLVFLLYTHSNIHKDFWQFSFILHSNLIENNIVDLRFYFYC